jgi:hypothetical protein
VKRRRSEKKENFLSIKHNKTQRNSNRQHQQKRFFVPTKEKQQIIYVPDTTILQEKFSDKVITLLGLLLPAVRLYVCGGGLNKIRF